MSSKRILVVEDEMIIGLDIESTLVDLGHVVTSAASRSEALARLDEQQFDLAIVDYHLKDGNAGPLASELVARGVPFIVCSGSAGIDELGEVFRSAAFLPKPFSTDGLVAAITGASSGRSD